MNKQHITDYLIYSKACDGLQNAIYKSPEAYEMVHSRWVGAIYHYKAHPKVIFLKSEVRPSQSISKKDYTAYVYLRPNGSVISAVCDCMAGLAKGCSHVAAILFKVFVAHRDGISGLSCTDTKCKWNTGSKKNVEPAAISAMNFQSKKLAYPEDNVKPKHCVSHQSFDDKEEMMDCIDGDSSSCECTMIENARQLDRTAPLLDS